MRLIGLTGGVATGKTVVAQYLMDKYNIPTISIDDASNEITEAGSQVLGGVIEYFGSECVCEDGSLNRDYLRGRVMKDEESRSHLEGLIIPAISNLVVSKLDALESLGHTTVVVESEKMFEHGTYKNYAEIILVSCSKESQIERIMTRDVVTEERALEMVESQFPLVEMEELSTYVIRNDDTMERLFESVDETLASVINPSELE